MCWWCWTMPGFFSGEFSIALITVMLWLRRQKTMMTMLMMTITMIVMVTLHHVFSGPGPRGGEGGRWTAIGRWSGGLPDDDDMMTWWYHSISNQHYYDHHDEPERTDRQPGLAGRLSGEGRLVHPEEELPDFDDFDEYQHHLIIKLSSNCQHCNSQEREG